MTTPPPHSEYIDAVVKACTQQEIPPSDMWIEDDSLDRYRDDEHSGVACMLSAILEWDADHPAVDRHVHRHGITLVWEHPAQHWMWAARKASGALLRDPEPLQALPRWAEPLLLPRVVGCLAKGYRVRFEPAQLWPEHAAAQAAVDAWEAAEISGQPVPARPAPDTLLIYRTNPKDPGEKVFAQLSSRLPDGAVSVLCEDGRLITVPVHHLTDATADDATK
ncbi:hypothetical protein [Streptomyces spectabilis]|uniref:Uncharacterized protein n=1 Tax=Streptomyces spectabilis TaxID=68270 RepID=A0A5P2X0Q8_STRST|nr:hypothetical protein [Streptomyces spectabilis]MBB5108359.1 hypothetical protein [Streptomyces spectabilis]MCI3901116.1 hypothetical protein [Streptomyces spectabilis]QEV58607.1 hypothetical protein CP982_07650 [Streptomyces spectabilis]GGV46061.1 hypothetical protein GCM10010245_72210 [Streptomyces spectabilis]